MQLKVLSVLSSDDNIDSITTTFIFKIFYEIGVNTTHSKKYTTPFIVVTDTVINNNNFP